MLDMQKTIEEAYADISNLKHPDLNLINAVNTVINTLDCGGVRVAEKIGENWHVNHWIKKAILLAFKIKMNKTIDAKWTKFHDKLDLKFTEYDSDMFRQEAIRVAPHAIVRKGAYVGRNTV